MFCIMQSIVLIMDAVVDRSKKRGTATEPLWPGADTPDRASEETEAMSTTNPRHKEDSTNERNEHDWCDGLAGNRLPCFACFDSARQSEAGNDVR